MQAFKIVLSVLAGLLVAASGVTTFGSFSVSPAVSELMSALGGALSWLGYTPFKVNPPTSRVFGAFSIALAGFVGSHAAAWGDGQKHVWVIGIGFLAALLGQLAHGPLAPPSADSTPKT